MPDGPDLAPSDGSAGWPSGSRPRKWCMG